MKIHGPIWVRFGSDLADGDRQPMIGQSTETRSSGREYLIVDW